MPISLEYFVGLCIGIAALWVRIEQRLTRIETKMDVTTERMDRLEEKD
jgi:hypothetical protein